jgi:hypothetical protein
MDKGFPRWRNTPPPLRGAQVFVIATCREQLQNGRLCVDLLGITYIGNAPTLPPPAPLPCDSDSKKRKFAAVAPPRPPLTGQQVSSLSSAENARASTSQVPSQRITPSAALEELIAAQTYPMTMSVPFFRANVAMLTHFSPLTVFHKTSPWTTKLPRFPVRLRLPTLRTLRSRRVQRGNEGLPVEFVNSRVKNPFHV